MRLHRLEARVDLPSMRMPSTGNSAMGTAAISVRRGDMWIMNASAKPPPAMVLGQVHDRRPDSHANGAQIVCQPRHEVAGAHRGCSMLRQADSNCLNKSLRRSNSIQRLTPFSSSRIQNRPTPPTRDTPIIAAAEEPDGRARCAGPNSVERSAQEPRHHARERRRADRENQPPCNIRCGMGGNTEAVVEGSSWLAYALPLLN